MTFILMTLVYHSDVSVIQIHSMIFVLQAANLLDTDIMDDDAIYVVEERRSPSVTGERRLSSVTDQASSLAKPMPIQG